MVLYLQGEKRQTDSQTCVSVIRICASEATLDVSILEEILNLDGREMKGIQILIPQLFALFQCFAHPLMKYIHPGLTSEIALNCTLIILQLLDTGNCLSRNFGEGKYPFSCPWSGIWHPLSHLVS